MSKLDDLQLRRAAIEQGGGADKIKKQHNNSLCNGLWGHLPACSPD